MGGLRIGGGKEGEGERRGPTSKGDGREERGDGK